MYITCVIPNAAVRKKDLQRCMKFASTSHGLLLRWSLILVEVSLRTLVVTTKVLPLTCRQYFTLLCCIVQVPQEVVDALHKQHYAAVVDLFDRHKGTFPGYEDVTLAVEHG